MIRNMMLAVGIFAMTGASAFAAAPRAASVHRTNTHTATVAQADEGSGDAAKTDGDKKPAKKGKKGGQKGGEKAEMKSAP